MEKLSVPIRGMHCKSCEILIEDELMKIDGVKHVEIDHKSGRAEIAYQGGRLDDRTVSLAVSHAGYSVGENKPSAFFSTNKQDYTELLYAGIISVLLFLIVKELGIFNVSVGGSGGYGSLAVVLMVGLTAGVSTCMALVGGLVLGLSTRFNQLYPDSSPAKRFTPHLFFNLGRIIGFFILGGIMGFFGSFFSISIGLTGAITVIIGAVMVFLGVQLLGIFPVFSSMNITLPKSVSRALGITTNKDNSYSHRQSVFLGALTFFVPCGFTQAIQLYAVSTGSFLTGALTMSVFAIGTIPGLLGIGGLASVIKKSYSRIFFKIVGVIVIALALFNISNGMNLIRVTGTLTNNHISTQTKTDPNVSMENGIQVVRMTQETNGYVPNEITVKMGVPVKWIIRSNNPYSCASSLIVPKLDIKALLTKEEKVFEFTPNEQGQIPFSCSMGMYSGVFNVTQD